MPRPRKPTNLKLLQGTSRPDRDKDRSDPFPTLDDVPEAPEWLPNAHAVKEFNRLADSLHAARVLTAASLVPLAHLAAIHGKIVQMWSAGECPPVGLVNNYRVLCGDFGLTPATATKVPQGGIKSGGNSFSGNGRKPD